MISNAYQQHFTYDWDNDKGTTEAFAYSGSGQFWNMYPYIIRNYGKFITIGEAVSTYHAWVVGALESARSRSLPSLEPSLLRSDHQQRTTGLQ